MIRWGRGYSPVAVDSASVSTVMLCGGLGTALVALLLGSGLTASVLNKG
jgi:hypothetical protein